jgi:hypothetical protein
MSRIVSKKGYVFPEAQYNCDYVPSASETVIIPSTNTPSWGSMLTIDFREQACLLQKLTLQFNLSAITVMTSGMYVPAQFFIDHIDYVQNGQIIDTHYPLDLFLRAQIFQRDEDRALENVASGSYSSTSQRTTLATAANSYYLPLFDYFRQAQQIPMLEPSHNLQLRIFLQPLASVTSGTGTATASITSINLLAKVIRLREKEAVALKNEMALKKQLHFKFNDLKQQSITVLSGTTSTSLVLNAITGPVSYLFFVVRPSASLTGNSAFAFTAISQYELMNSSGQNFVGGQPISNSQALLVLGNDIAKSSYLSETALGITNNNTNVYVYSFAADPVDSEINGVSSGTHNFTGNEQLKITFTSSLGANVQVDVYAYVESVLGVSKTGVHKNTYIHSC